MITQEYDFFHCDYTVEETDKYLHELVKSKYDDASVSQILEALDIAYRAHDGQLRANNFPYIIHPMRVALMLVKFERSTTSKVFIAALLHDTLECTSLTNAEIEQKFGKYLAKLVQSVTRRHDTKSLQEKRIAKLQKWQEIMLSSHEVRAISMFALLERG